MWEDGKGAKDIPSLKRLAGQGHAKAQVELGWMYEIGQGVKKGFRQAVSWYRKAAEQGHSGGQNNLGLMYAHGHGVRKDYRLALKWFRALPVCLS